jgi:hypothetical protein
VITLATDEIEAARHQLASDPVYSNMLTSSSSSITTTTSTNESKGGLNALGLGHIRMNTAPPPLPASSPNSSGGSQGWVAGPRDIKLQIWDTGNSLWLCLLRRIC